MGKRKKLKLNIKGKINTSSYSFFSKRKADKHGVKTHSLSYEEDDRIVVVLEGDRSDLWEIVHWNKKGPIFCDVEEVMFQFAEVTV